MTHHTRIFMVTSFLCICVVLMVIGYGIYSCRPIEYSIDVPINREHAIGDKRIRLEIPLPESAEEIYYYFQTPGIMAYTSFLRFKASKEDCVKYAEDVMTREEGMATYWSVRYIEGKNNASLSVPVAWNKISEIENGVEYMYNICDYSIEHQRASGLPTDYESIYIDLDRNILYYFRGD